MTTHQVFGEMLEHSHPPDDWSPLLAEAHAESARLQQLAVDMAK